ncbi:MAG: M55 family metallopeptidase [Candidatus Wallbacteria bacterium]|nr:M55 family metallopeptidase [Candidatus Wallbacteria bacterium]
MKIYISIDMEGIPGTFNWVQEKDFRSEVRKCMSMHLESVIRGIHESFANPSIDEIVVADSHSAGDSISYEFSAIDDRLHLISGGPRPQYMMPAFSSEFSMVFLIGYHGGKGLINSNMDHTYSSSCIHRFEINGMEVNEALINAAYAGCYGVPVTLITGDSSLKRQLTDSGLGKADFIVTKSAVSRFAAKNRPINVVRRETQAAVINVLKHGSSAYPVFKFHPPVRMKITFINTAMADVAALMPGVRRLDGSTVEFIHDDFKIGFDAIMAIIYIAYHGK